MKITGPKTFRRIFYNLFNTVDSESEENNTFAIVNNTTNRALSRCNKNFVLTSNIPLASLLYFVIDAINW